MSYQLQSISARQPLATANLRGMQDRWESPPEVEDADERDPEVGADVAIELIGRACRANNAAATADLLREAAKMLECIAQEVEAA